MGYINRHMEQRITELSKTWSAILLTGPRQSGKTTMLKNLAEKENIGRAYISLDDLTVREMAKNDPKMFLQLHKPPMIIDEVQYAPAELPFCICRRFLKGKLLGQNRAPLPQILRRLQRTVKS